MSITLTHEQIQNLVERLGEPDFEYAAAAGRDYGQAKAWQIGREWLIAESHGDETIYFMDDLVVDEDSLADILEDVGDIDTPLDRLVHRANVRGIKTIEPAKSDDAGPFVILKTRYYYGASEMTTALKDEDGEIQEFASYKEAAKYISEIESEVYRLSHNESGRPIYTIISL